MENKLSQRSSNTIRKTRKQGSYSANQELSPDKKTAFGPRYYSGNDAVDFAANNKRLEESVKKALKTIHKRRDEAKIREELSEMPPLPKTFHRAYSADDADDVATNNKRLEEDVEKGLKIIHKRRDNAKQRDENKRKEDEARELRLSNARDYADLLLPRLKEYTLTLSEQAYLEKNKNDKRTSDIMQKLNSPIYLIEEPGGEQRLVINDPEKETMVSFAIKKINQNSYALCTAAGVCLVVSLGVLFRKSRGGKRNTTRKAGVKK
jgi:hypothetical protein